MVIPDASRKNKILIISSIIVSISLALTILWLFLPKEKPHSQECLDTKAELETYMQSKTACSTVSDCIGVSITNAPFCDYYLLGTDADIAYIEETMFYFTNPGEKCWNGVTCELDTSPLEGKTAACENRKCTLKYFDEINSVDECFFIREASLPSEQEKECINYFAQRTADFKVCDELLVNFDMRERNACYENLTNTK